MARVLPQSVCDRAKILCRCHDERTVCRLLGISRSTIWQLKKRDWQTAGTTKRFRPMPSDFPIQVNHCTRAELAAHYHASNTAISRWKAQVAR